MKHITVEYYHAADKYDTSTCRIYEIWKRHAQGLPLRKQQIIHSVASSEVISKNNTSDRWSKKRKSGSNPRSVRISDSVNIINKTDMTNNPIKNVDEMDDLQAKLTQNHKEREEGKRESKRFIDSN
ncbi:12896_t:CDS:2 [Ambispora leptoticha]|uniref:12896_t:CDS:1 n=1 Tax=Ambispora leptoticha TaxID=144679 RepID=A0A9N9GKJ6_9GLOM|nr:12896_t:CDS:2 [Ambispora leptoticha]